MRVLNLRTATVALVAGLGLGGCAYSPYGGLGVGVGAGYGNGYYGDRYCDPYYDRYCSTYASSQYGYSPYGWYNDYYYPGSGYYVYDNYRRPYYWSNAQRRYWLERQRRYGGTPTTYWGDFEQRKPVLQRILRPRYLPADGQTTTTTVQSDGTQIRRVDRVRRSESVRSSDDRTVSERRTRSGVRIKRVRDKDDD